MTLRQYLFLMVLSTVLCWAGWFMVVRLVDPTGAGLIGFMLFYACLGLSLCGTLAVIGVCLRAVFRRHEAAARHVSTSFRQGILLSVLMVASLVLQAHALLNWKSLLLAIGALTLAEFLMISFNVGQPARSRDRI